MGQMSGALQDVSNQMNQQAFNQQLGRGASNQMYQSPAQYNPYYDPYTASRRPDYMPFGPNQQFYQPIYRPSYGPGPFGGFYQPPMMGFGQGSGQTQFGSMNFQGGDPGAFRNALMRQSERKGFGQPQRSLNDLGNFDLTGQGVFRNNPMPRHMMPPEMFGPATDISDQGQAALRQMPQQQDMFRPAADIFGPAGERSSVLSERVFPGPMLSPRPMQTQYRPIPAMNQTQLDAKAAAEAASVPVPMPSFSGDGAKAGGKVHGEGIDSLLRK
jgi:hypothetical protein